MTNNLVHGDEVKVSILDAEGSLMRSILMEESKGERNFGEIEITDLPVGVYMIHIVQNDFKEVKKLIIIK